MQKTTLIFVLLFSTSLLAQSRDRRGQTLQEIRFAAQDIQNTTRNSQASVQDLSQALSLLRQADRLLQGRSGGGSVFIECREFAFPVLDRVLASSDALDEASRQCRNVSDMSIMRFIYGKLSRVLSTRESIQRSAMAADSRMLGKGQLLEFTFSKYNRTLATDRSVDRSLAGLRSVVITRTGGPSVYTCFQKTFPQYDRTLATDEAMDRTIAACSRF